jgi:aspartokinase/homoserine dehydrogenase 1
MNKMRAYSYCNTIKKACVTSKRGTTMSVAKSGKKTISVGLIGPGLIGKTLISQMQHQKQSLMNEGIEMEVVAVANSKKMVLDSSSIDSDTAQPLDYDALASYLQKKSHPVIVDCTASDDPPSHYNAWANGGISLVTPNKKFSSGSLARYRGMERAQSSSGAHFFHEGTVGAGLPVLSTLQHLRRTGDIVTRIEGIFSGTLSYIFNTFGSDTRKFSEIVIAAKEAGYTEPDPRDDLAGMDVARKVTILGRESGLDLELEQVNVKSLVPEPLEDVSSAEEFLKRLPEFDDEMQKLLADAEEAGECLRFVGVVDPESKTGSVELRRYPKEHPFASLSGSDNIISFKTERYSDQPLIIRGPGAGAEVTAAGCFSDLLKFADAV